VLEGDEQIGKTEFVLALGGEWAGNLEMTMDSKEAHMSIAGRWVIELSELGSLRRSSLERIKQFISARHDSYVPKYSNNRVDIPRRCVFVGTTNDQDYLVGDSENTRFLPVETHLFNHDKVRKEREQALAEALLWWKANHNSWWFPPEDIQIVWQEKREERRELNPYEEQLSIWLNRDEQCAQEHITWPYIAKHFLELDNERMGNKLIQSQVTSALKRLGWARAPQKREPGGERVYPWVRPTLGAFSTREKAERNPSWEDYIDPNY
jgi:putative DNA primase/helicase